MGRGRRPAPRRTTAPEQRQQHHLLARLLLFLSGVAALVFQVIWIKQLSLVVGVDVYAVTTAVSAFFAGLGLGGFTLGRLADRSARPAIFYLALELAIAVCAVITTLVLARFAPAFATMEQWLMPLPWICVFGLVGVPAFLMGGTLPALARALTPAAGQAGSVGGALYAANTAGAVVGALAPVFVLIPAFGVQGAALAAAGLNVAAGLGALLLPARSPAAATEAPAGPAPAARHAPSPRAAPTMTADARLALGLYAIAGGLALGYEVVWSQVIVQFISTRAFAFSVVLATYLTGLAVGAAILARFADRIRRPWAVFGLLLAGAGVVALAEVALLGRWLAGTQTAAEAMMFAWTGNSLAGASARFLVAAGSIVLAPTLLLGAAFPLALRLVAGGQAGRTGGNVGAVVSVNTLGGVMGALLTGLVLVPALGLVRTLALLALAAAVLGLLAVWREKPASRWARVGGWGVLAVAVLLAVTTPAGRLAELLMESRRGALVAYEEARGATVAVLEQSMGRNRFRRLYIQGVSNSGDAMPSLRYMRLQALLPLIIHSGEPRSALVIGMGTGITAGALLRYPGMEKRVVAELLPAVVRAAPHFSGNYGVATDPRIDIRMRDGRRELLRSHDRYDLITLEPPPPAAAGVVNLYSRDFYALARDRLAAGGMVAQWLPLATQNGEDTRSLVRAFIDVFPHASLWTTDFHEMLLVGSMTPVELDAGRIARRMADPQVATTLAEVGVGSPAALLATWVTDRNGLAAWAGNAAAVTDDHPRIEYGTWLRPGVFQQTLPSLLQTQTPPPVINAGSELAAATAVESERLRLFYAAGLHAQAGDREAWRRDIVRLMQRAGDNPYYSWFTGGARKPAGSAAPGGSGPGAMRGGGAG
ncbi:fused MFS/spermidine synthase [Camelimonas fluminis]|uniref:Fused MFS/spermidine synthase n=1 Tax=Camelimonas fluminis TaxID=1576911 RepID=A0ABV7UGR2_9HYPH|nr:fused MFS/spermidine synthase [Camelimonas fluminis]